MKFVTVSMSLIGQKKSTLINIPYYDCEYAYILRYGICLPVATFHDNPSVPFQFKIAESHYGPAYTLRVSFAAGFDSWGRIFLFLYCCTLLHTRWHFKSSNITNTLLVSAKWNCACVTNTILKRYFPQITDAWSFKSSKLVYNIKTNSYQCYKHRNNQ